MLEIFQRFQFLQIFDFVARQIEVSQLWRTCSQITQTRRNSAGKFSILFEINIVVTSEKRAPVVREFQFL